MSDVDLAKKERKRLYGIKYRKDNAEKLKALHQWRLENDADYLRRYNLKQEKRKHLYQESHKEAVAERKKKSITLAIAREERERTRHREAKRKYRAENKEAHQEYYRAYQRANRETINAKRRDRWANDLKFRSKMQKARILSDYKISYDDYMNLYIESNGRCSICNASEADFASRGLAVDHCHTTGGVRGLLCSNCNTALGLLRDNVKLLQNAINYLTKE